MRTLLWLPWAGCNPNCRFHPSAMVPDLRCYRPRHQRWPIQRYAQGWQCDNLGCTPLGRRLLAGRLRKPAADRGSRRAQPDGSCGTCSVYRYEQSGQRPLASGAASRYGSGRHLDAPAKRPTPARRSAVQPTRRHPILGLWMVEEGDAGVVITRVAAGAAFRRAYAICPGKVLSRSIGTIPRCWKWRSSRKSTAATA